MHGIVAALVLTSASATAEPKATRRGELQPEPLHAGAALAPANGPRFVAANRRGDVFLLRGRGLEVARLTPAGALAGPLRLGASDSDGRTARAAAMSPAGCWLTVVEGRPLLFREGRGAGITPPYNAVEAAGFAGETPVLSLGMGTPQGVAPPPARPAGEPLPILVVQFGQRWDPLLEDADLALEPFAPGASRARWQVLRAVLMGTARDGKLWLAREYVYEVLKVSSGGRIVDRWRVGSSDLREVDEPEKAREALLRHAASSGVEIPAGAKVEANIYTPVVRGIAEGRDGRVYLVSTPPGEGGVFLDRYDPIQAAVERVPLALDYRGRLTMAAGRDGLVLAGFGGRTPLVRLRWEDLDGATWAKVPDVEFGPPAAGTN